MFIVIIKFLNKKPLKSKDSIYKYFNLFSKMELFKKNWKLNSF